MISGCARDEPIEWHMIDVNFYERLQGDAHLLIDNDIVTLVDAGYGGAIGDRLAEYLQSQKITVIDNFFISHPHRDHYEGILNVIKSGVKVNTVYFNHNTSAKDCCFDKDSFDDVTARLKLQGAKVTDIFSGDVIKLGSSWLEVISAPKSNLVNGLHIDLNDASVVMMWFVNKRKVLFTGDLNHKVGTSLVDSIPEKLNADILKVPHHGASGIAPEKFFSAVSPKLMMFPDPYWVKGDERGKIAFGYQQKHNLKYCSNSENKDVKIVFRENNVSIIPSLPTESCNVPTSMEFNDL